MHVAHKCKVDRPFFMSIKGEVIAGKQEARQLGTPTANISVALTIPEGVYAAFTDVPSLKLQKILSLVYYQKGTLESYLIHHNVDLYGHIIQVTLYDFIRPSLPFISMDHMRNQIKQDLGGLQKSFEKEKN
jgi:FAD synthase